MTVTAAVSGYMDTLMSGFNPQPRKREVQQSEFDQVVELAKAINEGQSIFMPDHYGNANVRRCQDHIFDIEEKDIEIAKEAYMYLSGHQLEAIQGLDHKAIIDKHNALFADMHNKESVFLDYFHIHGAITCIAIVHFVRHWREELIEALSYEDSAA